MLKALKIAFQYRDLLETAIEMIKIVQDSVSDSKLTKSEKSKIMAQMWVIIKKTQAIKKESGKE